MADCMEHCSRFWGNGEGCFGIVFVSSSNDCWIRNSTTSKLSNGKSVYTKSPLEDQEGTHSALVDITQMKPLETDCPETDGTQVDLKGFPGQKYTVRCNKDIGGSYDAHWTYTFFNNPFQAFYHATSLDDCVHKCMGEHPLCRGVVYNPGLQGGYANCWPKTGFDSNIPATGQLLKIAHSATLDQIDTPDTKCPKDEEYTSSDKDNSNFALHCGKANQGTNMTEIHATNFTSCMDACATNDKGCVGVVYDSSLQGGYDNCYLQNTSSVFTDVGSSMYAVLTGNKPKSSDSPSGGNGNNNNNGNGNGNNGNNSDGDNKSSSKAWIAGAIIGPLLGLALIGGLIWFFRRKKRAAYPAADELPADAPKTNPYAQTPQSQHHLNEPSQVYAQHAPQYSPLPASELGAGADHQMQEMEGASTAKYAHKGPGAGERTTQVHEMG